MTTPPNSRAPLQKDQSPRLAVTDQFEQENEEARGRMTMLGLMFVCMAGVVIGSLFALLVHTLFPW